MSRLDARRLGVGLAGMGLSNEPVRAAADDGYGAADAPSARAARGDAGPLDLLSSERGVLIYFIANKRFELRDFTQIQDPRVFLEAAFWGLLRRPIDPEAYQWFLEDAGDDVGRAHILKSLLFSEEGVKRGASIIEFMD